MRPAERSRPARGPSRGRARAAAAAVLLVSALSSAVAAHPGCGIAAVRDGSVLFVDATKNRILRVDADGKLSVLVADPEGTRLRTPHHLVVTSNGGLHTAGDADGVVWRIEPEGTLARVYPAADAPPGIAFVGHGGNPFTVDDAGALYALNERQHRHVQLVKVAADGRLAVLAGGEWGLADGRGAGARFRDLHGSSFAWGPDGGLYLVDGGTAVRRVFQDGHVATMAGGAEEGFADGPSDDARFRGAMGLCVDPVGAVYVADRDNHRIRKLDVENDVVTTVAGTGEDGSKDGPAAEALLSHPAGVARAGSGALFVLEYPGGGDRPRVRRISPDGRTVSTVANAADAP